MSYRPFAVKRAFEQKCINFRRSLQEGLDSPRIIPLQCLVYGAQTFLEPFVGNGR